MAPGSWEHEDKRSKLSIPEEKEIKWFQDYPMCASAMYATAMEASGSGEHEDKRWSIEKEITKVLDRSVKLSFPEEKRAKWNGSDEGQPHDFECLNALTIWTKSRKPKYSHIKEPKNIGEVIMSNLLELAGDMIQKSSVLDFGVVAFSLSRIWLAKSIHKVLKDGIDSWTPKLPVGKVMVDFPSLVEKLNLGWFRQHAIANTLIRMLCYCKVEVTFWPSYGDEFMACCPQLQRDYGETIVIKPGDTYDVIYVEENPPFILAKGDWNTFDRDLKALGYGICVIEADWIVYLTPVRQQEYIEMCFTAANLEGWIKNIEGKWNPRIELGYPVLTYAGYRTYSTEELPNLLEQLKDHCDMVALGEDAQLLGYNGEAVSTCVLMYTCLQSHRLADCTFNYDEMVKEEGNTFVYLLHRRAEVHRIIKNSRKDIDAIKKDSDLILEKDEGWEKSEERMLEFHLLSFTYALERSSLLVLPHILCEYLYDLSKKFKSYNDFVLKTRSAETSRLLLSEATAVVMEKCFHLLGITPEVTTATNLPMLRFARGQGSRLRSFANLPMDVCDHVAVEVGVEPQKMAERELMDGTRLDHDFVDYFITPCDVREPSRNSRFEIFAIAPTLATDDTTLTYLFGEISISDKYGSVLSDGGYGYHLWEPDFPHVYLFLHKWYDPVNIDRAQLVYLENPTSHHSVSFSSSIELHMELYASTKTKGDCFHLCNWDVDLDLNKIWREESDGKCVSSYFTGENGEITLYYILLKDAVDASLEFTFTFEMGTDREVYGHIIASYGDEFSYDLDGVKMDCFQKPRYTAKLFSSYPPSPGPVLKTSGLIRLKRSVLAVPKKASLTIVADFSEPGTRDTILYDCHNFKTPTKEDSSQGFFTAEGAGCHLDMKVTWEY